MVVANTVKSMGGGEGEVWIITDKGRNIIHAGGTKDAIAGAVFDSVEQVMGLAGDEFHECAKQNSLSGC
jgi:hypothetical protein